MTTKQTTEASTMGRKRIDDQPSQDDAPLLAGTVKTIAPGKGFGFLAGPDGRDYFFHKSETPDFDALDRGTPVRFIATSGPKGPRAASVQLA